ncbi:hypothetical protein KTG15_13005 [Methanobacterium sp. YSL]|nr:hypothetical protein [Methanobacterium sp. YSL]
MPELWIGLSAVVLILVLILVVIEQNRRRFLASIERKLAQFGSLRKQSNPSLGYILQTQTESVFIKLIYAPSAKEVSFNSKRHWQVFSGSGKHMLPTAGFQDLEGHKLIIVYPQPGKIVKYINENEIIFVKPETDVFGMRVVHIHQIESYFAALKS